MTSSTSPGYYRSPHAPIFADLITAGRTISEAIDYVRTEERRRALASPKMPTEIGLMTFADGRSWEDTDYIEFYFAYAAGLSAAGTQEMEKSCATPDYSSLRDLANDRDRANDERWPAYRAFAEITLAKLQGLLRTHGAEYEPFSAMLQLVDVEM